VRRPEETFDVNTHRRRWYQAELRQNGVPAADRGDAMKNMSKAQLLGSLLQRGTGIGYRDEVFTGLIQASHRGDTVEKIFHENVGFQSAAGFGGDDEQRRAEIDRPFERLDLFGIGAVQHVEARPTRLLSEGLAEHFRPQARPSHPQQDNVGEPALLHLLSKVEQPLNIGQLPLHGVQPADPLVLVPPGPKRIVAGPKPPNESFLPPDLHFLIEGRLHLRGARPDLQASAIALEQRTAAPRDGAEQLVERVRELLHALRD
jgi:hypothetical protein